MNHLLRRLASAAALGLPLASPAQPAGSDAAQATSPEARLPYRSAFADYRPYQDARRADWRALNDTVGGASSLAGGHAGHRMDGMKRMDMPHAPAAAASAPVPMKPMPAHEHRHPHGGKK